MARTPLSIWLDKQISEYIHSQQRRVSLEEVAEYLDIKGASLSHYLHGRRTPSDETIAAIASKFGEEIYDVLDMPRPDPLLQEIIKLWPSISETNRLALNEAAKKYSLEK